MDYRSGIQKRMKDTSSAKQFSFMLACDCCGRIYRTFPIRIDVLMETQSEAWDKAYAQALDDFSQIISRCLRCGHFVCDCCIVVDERGHLCKNCENGGDYSDGV